MGRYDFRPSRVHQATTQLLSTGKITQKPPWYDIVGNIPPGQIHVRTQPHQHDLSPRRATKTRKPSKLFKPHRIVYEEDLLRKQFFKDHPWELARPRLVLENDGQDSRRMDWSKIRQIGKPLDGESVIQRQLYLLTHENLTRPQAYDKARQEFYAERLHEDVERHVAKEEAEATGAYFGKSMLEVGMELEDNAYEKWKLWAVQEAKDQEMRRAALYTGSNGAPLAGDSGTDVESPETKAQLEGLGAAIPESGRPETPVVGS